METGYLDFMINGMAPALDMVPDPVDRRLILAGMLFNARQLAHPPSDLLTHFSADGGF